MRSPARHHPGAMNISHEPSQDQETREPLPEGGKAPDQSAVE